MDPFDSSDDSDDDIFFRMMYHYYTTDLLQPDPAPLLTRRAMLNRNREEGHEHLYRDYFADNCVYGAKDFKRRFRLSRDVFLRIANALESRYHLFTIFLYKINKNVLHVSLILQHMQYIFKL